MASVDRRGVSLSAIDTAIAGVPNPNLAIKAPCRVATTANITLAGLQTIDGIVLADGNRVLVWKQTDAKQNGLYNASSGNWTRTVDADGNDEWAHGTLVLVHSGTLYAGNLFQCTTADQISLGTSNIAFTAVNPVPASRIINTTAPLAGGGALSADLTLSLSYGATLAVVGGALRTVAMSGDVTSAANSFATTIAANAVTYAKFQQVAASSLVGNATGSLANATGITLGATLAFSGSSLRTAAGTGDVTWSANSFVTTLANSGVTAATYGAVNAVPIVTFDAKGRATTASSATIREVLTANRTYYVRTDGSNSNTGLVDSAGGAFLTIQKAIDVIWGTIDAGGKDITIQVRAGTYTGAISINGRHTGGGSVTLVGDAVTPSNVLLSVTGAAALSVINGARAVASGFKFVTITSGACVSVADGGSKLEVLNFVMGACAASHFQVDNHGICIAYATGVYTINGSAGSHVHATNHGFFYASSGTITLSGTPAFSNFFLGISENATAKFEGITFSGAATGQRAFVHTGAMVNIGGTHDETFFPGNAAILVSEGGDYDGMLGAFQIRFAATQIPSSDPNTLDDYEEGTWTPVLTFATPGDLSVTYSVQSGVYTKIGRLIKIDYVIATSAFTHSTASGVSRITGLPFTSANVANQNCQGPLSWQGITKVNYTNAICRNTANSAFIEVLLSGSGQNIATAAVADMPTGGTVIFAGGLQYVV